MTDRELAERLREYARRLTYNEGESEAAMKHTMFEAAARLEQIAGAERIYVVIDHEGLPDFSAPYPEACHEHINDAINQHDIDGAEKWVVRTFIRLPEER